MLSMSLSSTIPGFLPFHCIQQLLKSRVFSKHKVNKTWIYIITTGVHQGPTSVSATSADRGLHQQHPHHTQLRSQLSPRASDGGGDQSNFLTSNVQPRLRDWSRVFQSVCVPTVLQVFSSGRRRVCRDSLRDCFFLCCDWQVPSSLTCAWSRTG